jgi:hypothetical protein
MAVKRAFIAVLSLAVALALFATTLVIVHRLVEWMYPPPPRWDYAPFFVHAHRQEHQNHARKFLLQPAEIVIVCG